MSPCVNIAFASMGLPKRGRVESSSCSRKSANKLAANRSTILKERLVLVERFVASLSTLSSAREG